MQTSIMRYVTHQQYMMNPPAITIWQPDIMIQQQDDLLQKIPTEEVKQNMEPGTCIRIAPIIR